MTWSIVAHDPATDAFAVAVAAIILCLILLPQRPGRHPEALEQA